MQYLVNTLIIYLISFICHLTNCQNVGLISTWKSSPSPPKLALLSHTQTDDTIDINANESVHIRCTGGKPMLWLFPNNNPYDPISELATIKSRCDDSSRSQRCSTDVIISNINYEMTGFYTCHYNDSNKATNDNSDSVYIYVNDGENLLVPYEGNTDFMFIAVFQSQPATIPCKPTNSKSQVSLWKIHTLSGEPQEIVVDPNIGITFNPKKGFHFEYPRWDSETSLLECRVKLDGYEHVSQVNIHWSILPVELHPLIDDNSAKNVFVNSTFTLKCFVHIELGVIIVITWDGPNLGKSSRVTETIAETQRIDLNGNSYDTVSKNLTVNKAQMSDQGIYHCNITDGNGRVFSVSKYVTVYEDGLPPSFVNFTMDINNNKPLIRNLHDNVRFVVDVHAFPDFDSVQLLWHINGEPIDKNDKHYKTGVSKDGQYPQAYLSITSIDLEDSGIYMLVGNTSDMVSNITMQLLVRGQAAVKLINTFDYYDLGKHYLLECLAIGYPKANVWWRWLSCRSPTSCLKIDEINWIDVNTESNASLNMLVNSEQLIWTNETTLWLNQLWLQVLANQSGLYRCYAQNINGTTIYQQTSFIVTDAIDGFSLVSSTLDPIEMDDITLTCKASVFNYTQLKWHWRSLTDKSDFDVQNMTDLLQTSEDDEYSLTISLQINSAQISNSGYYICEAKSKDPNNLIETKQIKLDIQNISAPEVLSSNMNGQLVEKVSTLMTEFWCFVTGRPKPVITWFRNNKEFIADGTAGIKLEDGDQKLIFQRLLDKDSGLYKCVAENRGGKVVRSVRLSVLGTNDDGVSTEELFVIVLFVIVGVVMIFMAVYIGKKIRQERKQKREMDFFSHNLFETGQIEMFNPDMPLDEQIELLPYDTRYEFPKERLKLGRTLGQGAFGRVVKAEAIGLEDGETSTVVAVKMLKERADINQRKALMAELKILIHLGRHLNIVNLLGAVTKNLVKGELMVIVEYCKFGNLRHYLLAYRDSFINQLNPQTGRIDPNIKTKQDMKHCKHNSGPVYANVFAANGINNPNYTTSPVSKCSDNKYSVSKKEYVRYADIVHQQNSGSNGYNVTVNTGNGFINNNRDIYSDSGSGSGGSGSGTGNGVFSGYRGESIRKITKDKAVTTCDLLCFAFQCARGMQYLASRKLIHRDLAARNVLLADDNIVKICDFGLAKDVYKYDNYVKKNDGPLPIKWMAIESIRDKVFTSKSDVWSFGILLWEFFTLGGNPYPGVEIDEEFYKRLKAGYRMEKPEFSPNESYRLMNHCWQAEPKDRPDFSEIADIIGNLLEANVRQHYLDLNDPYQEMNEQILIQSDYLLMSTQNLSARLTINGDYLNMKVDDDRKSDPLTHYDNITNVRPVNSGAPVPKEPMEVVPMIQLDSYGCRFDRANWVQTDDYLHMNSNNSRDNQTKENNCSNGSSPSSSEVSPPPPYNFAIEKL